MIDDSSPLDPWPGKPLSALLAEPGLNITAVLTSEPPATVMITDVHTTEAIDPSPYVRAGELICTVGTALTSAANCANFVHAVSRAGAVAICLGLGEVHLHAPTPLIDECRRAGMPLVEMATGTPFTEISVRLADDRLRLHTAATERDDQIIAGMLTLLQGGALTSELITECERALGGRFLFWHRGELQEHAARELLNAPEDSGSVHRVRLNAEESLLWAPDDSHPALETGALHQIGRVLQVAHRNEFEKLRQQSRRIGELFTLVANGLARPGSLAADLASGGMEDAPLSVSAWPRGTFHLLVEQFGSGLIADTGDELLVASATPTDAHGIAQRLGLVCGYSSAIEQPELQRGILEARAALRVARKQGRVCGPESLTTIETLLEQQPPGLLAPFVHQLIGPLLDPKVRGGRDLLGTLQAFMAHNGSLKATAQAEFLHINTVRHRLSRIHSIVGKNPLDFADLADLRIGLWAYRASEARR
ncbi:PucR family transcriptional regulator ligand-binding domain-containing protein [Leucobacter sp. gxy201]|uniref:PucR family transcriptional regulator n=1 Tax=Leucobacter sp. gxy201 TaxID=2957200 RepID=UPI003DA0DAA0